jgi:hypothetical protein
MKRRDRAVSMSDTGKIEGLRELEFILAGRSAS